MTNTFTLDDIRSAADKKYGSTIIEIDESRRVEMVNFLRLPKDARAQLKSIQKRLDASDDPEVETDTEDAMREMIRVVSRGPVEDLLECVGEDLTMLAELISAYTAKTELGEASASQS